jgi:hypothetical protein
MLPRAYVSPAKMRAPRDLRRRRLSLPRQRAAWLAPLQHPTRQDHRPEIGTQLASKANRPGVAERCPAPAVPKRMAGDRALIGSDDHGLSDVALHIVHVAKPHAAPPVSLLQTVPGIGNILSLGLRYEMPEIARFPRVPDVVSSCRGVKGAQASAGPRSGTAGPTLGQAHLQGAFSEAVGRCLREHPAGHKSLPRLEKKHGQGPALPVLAQPLARAVYDRRKRHTACERQPWLQAEGSGACAPVVSLDAHGLHLSGTRGPLRRGASVNAAEGRGHGP